LRPGRPRRKRGSDCLAPSWQNGNALAPYCEEGAGCAGGAGGGGKGRATEGSGAGASAPGEPCGEGATSSGAFDFGFAPVCACSDNCTVQFFCSPESISKKPVRS
jgi:hypothetical protein